MRSSEIRQIFLRKQTNQGESEFPDAMFIGDVSPIHSTPRLPVSDVDAMNVTNLSLPTTGGEKNRRNGYRTD